jgi:hypothetical protein
MRKFKYSIQECPEVRKIKEIDKFFENFQKLSLIFEEISKLPTKKEQNFRRLWIIPHTLLETLDIQSFIKDAFTH